MAESVLATMQRKQIEITIGELLLTDDFYMRLEITERLRHLIAHADFRWIGRSLVRVLWKSLRL